MGALSRGLALGLWAAVLLRSAGDGRLDLLLRAQYHPLVVLAGGLLAALAVAQLLVALGWRRRRVADPGRWPATLATAGVAVLLLALPPDPSFADLAARRPQDLVAAESGLNFVLPPLQRSLTDWVRLLREQPDPRLYDGDAVRVSGFVLPVSGEPPRLARLLVRCCLADAAPVGLPVAWPADRPWPPADQWLAVEGVMRQVRSADGQARLVIVPSQIRRIPRPARPLEP
ncbi:MAG: TIGR03943 family protein [Cyanobacteriota bacterium]|nr:TIGR03943 family protein [Cyanobacteriota bacterium]